MIRHARYLTAGCTLMLLSFTAQGENVDHRLATAGDQITWSEFQTLAAVESEKASRQADQTTTPSLTSTTGTITWSEVEPLSVVQARQQADADRSSDPAPLTSTTGTISWSEVQPLSEFEASRAAAAVNDERAASDERAIASDEPSTGMAVSDEDRSRYVELQRYLVYFGYDIGGVNGEVDERTLAALQSWQRARSLVPDGQVSDSLLNRMAGEINSSAIGTRSDPALEVSSNAMQ